MRVGMSNDYNVFINRQHKLSENIGFASVLSQKVCTDQNKANHTMDTFQTIAGSPYHNELPSFVGKAYTREELLQSVNDEVKQNQSKKMSLADMIKSAHFEGTRAKFRFAGDSKIYTFDEYIQELEKRSKK